MGLDKGSESRVCPSSPARRSFPAVGFCPPPVPNSQQPGVSLLSPQFASGRTSPRSTHTAWGCLHLLRDTSAASVKFHGFLAHSFSVPNRPRFTHPPAEGPLGCFRARQSRGHLLETSTRRFPCGHQSSTPSGVCHGARWPVARTRMFGAVPPRAAAASRVPSSSGGRVPLLVSSPAFRAVRGWTVAFLGGV